MNLENLLILAVESILIYWAVTILLDWLGVVPRSQEASKIAKELEKGELIPLTVEVAGNTYLCYNSITKEFVCQGSDLDEIVQHFQARHPDKSASIYNGDVAAVEILRAQLNNKRVKL
jgi:hypothetical protein